MYKLTDNDKTFGPFTWGKSTWNAWRLELQSDHDDSPKEKYPEGKSYNLLVLHLGTLGIFSLTLPCLIQPHQVKVYPQWDSVTVERLGRNWYYDRTERRYGVSLNGGDFLQVFYGIQSNDSTTEQHWSTFLPWSQTRLVRHEYYDQDDKLHWEDLYLRMGVSPDREAYIERREAIDSCPSVDYSLIDYDGTLVTLKTKIIRCQWSKGVGRFKWLAWFYKDETRKSLELSFDQPVGRGKGSWKGGLMSHSFEMLEGESREDAVKRYCAKDHPSREGDYTLTFVKAI